MSIRIEQYSRLPTLPTTALEVIRLFGDPDCTLDQLTAVIRPDPAIVSRLLKVANSAEYGGRGEITELRRAVIKLGRNTVTPLVLSFSLAQQSLTSGSHARHFEAFWQRSFYRATAAEVVSSGMGSSAFRGECYTTALLLGIGQLALLKAAADDYSALLDTADADPTALDDLEREAFGFTHMELSTELLGSLGLPGRIVETVRAVSRHGGRNATEGDSQRPLVHVIRTADAVARLLCDGDRGAAIVVLEESLDALPFEGQLPSSDVMEQVCQRIEATARLFDIDASVLPSAEELLETALDQLSTFAVRASVDRETADVPRELLEENGQLKRRVAELLRISQVDSLTRLANRDFLKLQFSERAEVAAIREQRLGMAVIDIDHFKQVNDRYGHLVGDEVLAAVGSILSLNTRAGDLVGRYGGEEFVVLIDNPAADSLRQLGERYRSAIAAQEIPVGGERLRVTVSVGVCAAPATGRRKQFLHDLFTAADEAMYEAKQSGRNRVVVHDLPGADCTAPALSHATTPSGNNVA